MARPEALASQWLEVTMPNVPINSGRVEKGGSPNSDAVGAVPLALKIRATSAVSISSAPFRLFAVPY
jgi:hypothetical protein